MKIAIALLASTLLACSSSSSAEPFTCALGTLSGTWRLHYTETDGSCGKLADETTIIAPGKSSPGSAGCTYATTTISPDKCRADDDFTCPLMGISGTQHWVGTTTQVGATELSSSFTLSIAGAAGVCRSSYSVDWERQ